jgi:hypothetical protein
MSECPHCGFNYSESETSAERDSVCPVCGKSLQTQPRKLESGLTLIQNYFERLWKILAHPALFFRELPQDEALAGPLAFALVTHWLGSAFNYLWHLAIGVSMTDFMQDLMMRAGDSIQIDNPGRNAQLLQLRDQVTSWFFSASSIITDPFFTLVSILFTSSLVFIGARILVPRKTNVNFSSAVKIISYGMTPAILAAIPALGGAIASFYTVIVTIIGAREVYRISNTRAFFVALFPKVLFVGILMFGFLFFAISIVQLFASFF